jgi:hypothetical protein
MIRPKKCVVPLEPCDANRSAVDFDRRKRTRANAEMRRAAKDALTRLETKSRYLPSTQQGVGSFFGDDSVAQIVEEWTQCKSAKVGGRATTSTCIGELM